MMKYRIKAAWRCLSGKPMIFGLKGTGPLELSGIRDCHVYCCDFTVPLEAPQ